MYSLRRLRTAQDELGKLRSTFLLRLTPMHDDRSNTYIQIAASYVHIDLSESSQYIHWQDQ